jgi:hypothetical protein
LFGNQEENGKNHGHHEADTLEKSGMGHANIKPTNRNFFFFFFCFLPKKKPRYVSPHARPKARTSHSVSWDIVPVLVKQTMNLADNSLVLFDGMRIQNTLVGRRRTRDNWKRRDAIQYQAAEQCSRGRFM